MNFFGACIFSLLFISQVFANGATYTANANKDLRNLYIETMKNILTNTIYEDMNLDRRLVGIDYPQYGHTMIGIKRMDNIHNLMKNVFREEIPGDCIETGVWRGGATIFMKAILFAYNQEHRKVWVADSFEGLPKPNADQYPADKNDKHYLNSKLAVSLEEVRDNFKKYNLLDKNVIFYKGYFSDTLHKCPINEIAILRLDGDMYESTIVALDALYPKLSKGGYIIIDDYYCLGQCRRAVDEYRSRNNITEKMTQVDWTCVYWKKTN